MSIFLIVKSPRIIFYLIFDSHFIWHSFSEFSIIVDIYQGIDKYLMNEWIYSEYINMSAIGNPRHKKF